ncbi:MAG: cytochrome C [Proteobacteria bacterium]|nr:cytochrome C [Pseudomonadota bacterium]
MKKCIALMSALVMVFALLGVCAFASGPDLYARCAGCHGADGSKQAMGVSIVLKGQSAVELEKKMQGYLDGSYGGAKKMIMTNTLKKLDPEQLKELAAQIAGF